MHTHTHTHTDLITRARDLHGHGHGIYTGTARGARNNYQVCTHTVPKQDHLILNPRT